MYGNDESYYGNPYPVYVEPSEYDLQRAADRATTVNQRRAINDAAEAAANPFTPPTTTYRYGQNPAEWWSVPGLTWTGRSTYNYGPRYLRKWPEGSSPTGSGPSETPRSDWVWATSPFYEKQEPASSEPGYFSLAPTTTEVTVPEWAASRYETPEAMWRDVMAMPAEQRTDRLRQMQNDYRAQQSNEAARTASLTGLGNMKADVEASREAWRTNPEIASLLESLRTSAAPEARVISPREETEAMTQLGEAYARRLATEQVSGSTRGSLAGLGGSRQAMLRAAADRAGLTVGSEIDRTNREARDRATSALGTLTQGQADLDLQYGNLLSGLADRIAGYESSIDYEPGSELSWAELTAARDYFTRAMDLSEAEQEESSKTSLADLAPVLMLGAQLMGS